MGNFIANAFVEVSCVEKMKELYVDIKRFYGRPCDNLLYSPNGNVVAFNETEVWSMFSKYPNAEHFIDCNRYANGDEDLAVDLFLALAEMREGDNRNNRFVRLSNEYYGDLDIYAGFGFEQLWLFSEIDEVWQHATQNATPIELAEAVQSGAITKEQLCK